MLKSIQLFILSTAICILSLGIATANADEISLVGVGTFSNYSGSSDSISTKLGLGGGALVDLFMTPMTSFEFGGLYVTNKVDDTTLGLTVSSNYLQVPVLFRYWFTPMVTLGAGGFWEHGMGTPTSTSDSSGVSGNASFAKDDDFGVVGSLGFRFPLASSTNLLVDGRYLRGLTNLNAGSGNSEYFSDIQVLAGLSFEF